jgi:hypothetical protein
MQKLVECFGQTNAVVGNRRLFVHTFDIPT